MSHLQASPPSLTPPPSFPGSQTFPQLIYHFLLCPHLHEPLKPSFIPKLQISSNKHSPTASSSTDCPDVLSLLLPWVTRPTPLSVQVPQSFPSPAVHGALRAGLAIAGPPPPGRCLRVGGEAIGGRSPRLSGVYKARLHGARSAGLPQPSPTPHSRVSAASQGRRAPEP